MKPAHCKTLAISLISSTLLCLLIEAAEKPPSADDAWYTEPQVYQFRPRVDRGREFGSIGVTGIEASIRKGVVLIVDSVVAKSPADGRCRAQAATVVADLRMMKTREKISGTFRSEAHAQAFCDIRSVISSVRKQSIGMISALTLLIESPKILGNQLAGALQT